MRILGIETSCDETAAAVLEVDRREFIVRSNVIASQIKIHAKTGGVVPEVAARAHVEKILPVVEQALKESKSDITKHSAAAPNFAMRGGEAIDAIAVTAGPGLMTSLLVGVEVARTLAYFWKKPLIAVNHLAGHIYANWLPSPGLRPPSPRGRGKGEGRMKFPALCLIVSGGHTELVLMRRHMDFKIIGSTRDDAAGEAFDKVAKMLGLPYPGGPVVSKLAESGRSDAIAFPRPMIASPDFDFSFSGLKTSALYWLKGNKLSAMRLNNHLPLPAGVYGQLAQPPTMNDFCASFEQAIVDVLVSKTIRAAKKYGVKTVMLGGGVSANKRLREELGRAVHTQLPTVNFELPSMNYTTDNAAMIAAVGYFMAQAKQFTSWEKLEVDPNWEIGTKFKTILR